MRLTRLLFACALAALFCVPAAAESPAAAAAGLFTARDQVPDRFKWDLTLFYPGWDEWDADLVEMERLYGELAGFRGRLAEGPDTLEALFALSDAAGQLSGRVSGYAALYRDIDTRDNGVQARWRRLMAVYSRIGPMLSWMRPEILSIPEETLMGWVDQRPELEPQRFGLGEMYRTAEYTLDEAGERLLSLHGPVRRTANDIFSALTDTDGDRPEITLASGERAVVTPGFYQQVLGTFADPADRRAVLGAWMEQYHARRNTFATIYNGVVQQGWATARARGYSSTLEMALHRNAIPEAVVTELIAAARAGAGELQRYHRLRQRLLGLERYGWSDMHVPLLPDGARYDYERIVPWVIESVAPLGAEYQSMMAGQFAEGLVDVFETPGKRSGAYNSGCYGVGSFVLLNYNGTLDDVFTVAHEMGHSMHTRLSQEHQPFATHRYTIFVAEVAAVLNEKLLLRKLLQAVDSARERVAFLERQIKGIHSTFFLQTMMADFEIQAHRLAEQGQGITADVLSALWEETVRAYFGDVIPADDPYLMSWARIPHLYNSPFYVYQYATCYASSAAFMEQFDADPAAVGRYLELLKSGGNDHPMRQLHKAGVDLTDPRVVQAVVAEFSRLVDRLEAELTTARRGG